MSITNSGWCVIDDAENPSSVFGSVKSSPGHCDTERFNTIIELLLCKVIFRSDLDKILIENYAFQTRKGDTLVRLAELCGALKNRLIKSGVKTNQIWVCSPSTLKKYVLGTGVGEKSQMLKEVYRKWGLDVTDDNQADAFALSKLCQELFFYTQNPEYRCSKKHEHECVISLIAQNGMASSLVRKFKN